MKRPSLRARLRSVVNRLPFRIALTLAALAGGPWVVGAALWYWISVLRAFGVELVPTR